jgi:hypothetical protein
VPIRKTKPTWRACGPFDVSFSIVGGVACSGTGPRCSPGWSECNFFGGFPCFCAPPDIASRFQAITTGVRNCTYTCIFGTAGFPFGVGARFNCECATCPPGFHYDPASGYCLDTTCPAGFCFCVTTGTCYPCPSTGKRCDGVATNTWDPLRCLWVATPPPCGPQEHFDWLTCACVPCPLNQCWCAPEGRCIDCDGEHDPPCKVERSCAWNTLTCQWDCTTPACSPGEHYDLKVCRCVSDCPTGQCWCEASSPPACIDCTPPDCHAELHCVWDVSSCTWACDDPATICGPDRTWDAAHCKCSNPDIWNQKTPWGGLHEASTVKGIRYRAADLAEAPFTTDTQVTTDPADSEARMVRDWNGRTYLLNSHLGRVVERTSDDEGQTFTHPRTLTMAAKHPTPCGPHKYTGLMVFAWYDGGVLKAQRRYPGDTAAGATFTLQNDSGGNLAVDDGTFHIEPLDDGPGRWLLSAIVGGAEKRFQSWDECSTFKEIV